MKRCKTGGEGGIRTLGSRLTNTRLAGEHHRPLGHFSGHKQEGL